MIYFDFDQPVKRIGSDSIKWGHYPPDVLPMWVADMDFLSPPAVIQAVQDRASHGVYGYGTDSLPLRLAILNWLETRYAWHLAPEDLVFTPGVISGFNLACQGLTQPGDGLLIQTPVYPPILEANANAGLIRNEMELSQGSDGSYFIDFDRFEDAITPQTDLFLLCNPHNPVGRVFTKNELEQMADICLRYDVLICSDEIHSDLVFSRSRHIPIATLDPQIAANTVTLMAPSKTFNIAGLDLAFAVIPNRELRARFLGAQRGITGHPNVFGTTAALAAYQEGEAWLRDLMVYLEGNRDYLYETIQEQMPGIRMNIPESTYLAWLDCRDAGLGDHPAVFFEANARVGLNDGCVFGRGGEGYVRLNFGCPRTLLEQGLARMRSAVEARRTSVVW